jgi:hypothetical protein
MSLQAVPSTNQDAIEKMARITYARSLTTINEYMVGNNDPEFALKVANSKIGDVGRVVPEKKSDPNAGLAVINIVFQNGSMQATLTPVVPPADVVDVEATPLLEATPFMSAFTNINTDLAGLAA